jgi:hypothetical protein
MDPEDHSPAAPARRAWWLFVHQLPPHPPGLRAKVWRRLQPEDVVKNLMSGGLWPTLRERPFSKIANHQM